MNAPTEFDLMEPLPETVLVTCVARADSWEPAARHYRDVEVVK